MQSFFENYKVSEATNTKRVICTPPLFTKQHFFYVQEAGYLKSLKPHLSRRSHLDSFLFLIVLSGSGTVTYQNCPHTAVLGDCFYINCMNEYTHISSENDPWELLWIHFNGPQAAAYYAYFSEHHAWHFHPENLEELTRRMTHILTLHEHRNDDTDLVVAGEITAILTHACASENSIKCSDSALKEKLKKITRYLDEHYTETISLDFLAQQFYISKYYLSREFKKEHGTTIIQYILAKKITHAKELLRYSTSSIEDIAALCGIDDASYFNKVFKKWECCTASEYRRRW